MSRNKTVLLILLIVILYFITPNDGVFATVKINFLHLLPYIMVAVIVYLVITISVLKRAWKKLDAQISDENVINFAKIMNISFDVKRMLGTNNLIDLYRKVNFSKNASLHAKELLYAAMRRKRLDVPPPGKGTDIDAVLDKPKRSAEEIKAARIEATIQAKKRKKKK